jgi:putative ABC transport system ATP-binding protein
MDLIGELVHARGVAAVVTTHDASLVRRADRVVELHDGVGSARRGNDARPDERRQQERS